MQKALNKEQIINFLAQANKPFDVISLNQTLNLNDPADTKALIQILNELEADHVIMINNAGKIQYLDPTHYVNGILSVNQKGFGFISTETKGKDYFVNARDLNGALDGDRVLCRLKPATNDGKKQEAIIIKVIEHSTQNIVGIVHFNKKTRRLWFEIQNVKLQNYESKIINFKIAQPEHLYVASLVDVKNNILEIQLEKDLGLATERGNDIMGVVYEKGIRSEFPQPAIRQAQAINDQIEVKPDPLRRDITDLDLVTIDGDDSKDFDDAVYVEQLSSGNYRLVVAIADVANYVTAQSPLDEEAIARGCSVYLLNKVVPMLPEKLSNDVCSLMPNVVRLCMVCDMEIDQRGELVSHSIYQGYMRSKARLTYGAVNKLFTGESTEIANPIQVMLNKARALYDIMWARRFERGIVDFQIQEPKFILGDRDQILDVTLRSRGDAEQLIECFMIQANEVVAQTVFWMDLPFIYRIHAQPKRQKLEELASQLSVLNVGIKGKLDNIHSKDIQQILLKLKDNPNFSVISSMFLRSMEKAKYDITNVGHFGLASDCYTHFTSPIRRYPDLIVHRALKQYLINQEVSGDVVEKNTLYFEYAAEMSSKNELKAVDCERDVVQMKKAEYMMQYVNQQFEGVVSGVTRFGVFVELPNTVEGLIHISDLKDDFYSFDERNNILVGKNPNHKFQLGQPISVVVKKADKKARTIDFVVAKKNK